ncbi:hypothetical protein SHIRM173S_12682 [Streptomyces hirsutus]
MTAETTTSRSTTVAKARTKGSGPPRDTRGSCLLHRARVDSPISRATSAAKDRAVRTALAGSEK